MRSNDLPTLADVQSAEALLRGVITRTPLLEFADLNDRVGGRVLLKAESLQRTGTFKFRGAYTRLAQLADEERANGIIASSSGNFAQGLACAASLLGISATIVMPKDAPRTKVDNTHKHDAEIVFVERGIYDLEADAMRLAEERGQTFVHPFEDRDVIAGQGTVGLEIAEQAAERHVILHALLIPCGGGSLTSGCALAMEATSPGTSLYSVEPETFGSMAQSLLAGERVTIDPAAPSICDALLLAKPGNNAFAISKSRLAGGLLVSDVESLEAVAYGFHTLKLVLEPAGAVALAAVLTGKIDCGGKTVAVVLSGGNMDPGPYCSALLPHTASRIHSGSNGNAVS